MEEDENDEVEYGLLLPFDSDDPEFTRGFEAGMLWENFQNPNLVYMERTVSGKNAEMIMRMTERWGWEYRASLLEHDWMHVVLKRKENGD